ncbi:hypothetical protein ILYODFUR_027295 [Ilyodon furcidens]|uniref:Uncharacterized protein n=1 Tax=Ilyodon furcidens TaxID=33524 RepID=A0ABV0T0N3_9TELE
MSHVKTTTDAPLSSTSPSALTICMDKIKAWMEHNFELHPGWPPHKKFRFIFSHQHYSRLDPNLTVEDHIKHLYKIYFLLFRSMAKLCPMLPLFDVKKDKLIQDFGSSRLGCSKALLSEIPRKYSIETLQISRILFLGP